MDKDGDVDDDDRNDPDQPEHCDPNDENDEPEIPAPSGDPTNPGEDEPPQVSGSVIFLPFGLSIGGMFGAVIKRRKQLKKSINL